MPLVEHIFNDLDESIKKSKKKKGNENENMNEIKNGTKTSEPVRRWDKVAENVAREKTIYHERYEKQKKNNQKRFVAKELVDEETMNNMLDKEADKHLTRYNWTRLDTCFRWRIMDIYIKEKAFKLEDRDVAFLKKALFNKEMMLHVDYDKNTQSIKMMHLTLPSGLKI